MKAILHNKKLFNHDIVAFAVACIISLLFTNQVAEFFSHVGKKHDHGGVVATGFTGHEGLETNDLANIHLPFEDLNADLGRYALAPSVVRLQRLAMVNTSAKKVDAVSQGGVGVVAWHPNYILPVGWRTSISIAQRKLII